MPRGKETPAWAAAQLELESLGARNPLSPEEKERLEKIVQKGEKRDDRK